MIHVLADLAVYLAGAIVFAGLVRWWRRGDPPWGWVALYGVAALLFVGPALLTPRHQVVTDSAHAWLPWKETVEAKIPADATAGRATVQGAPLWDGRVLGSNPLLADPLLQMYPWRTLARQRLLAGEAPLWSHEMGTGQPFLGNAQTSPYAPVHLLSLPLPPLRAMTVAAAWQLLIALLLTHVLLRALGGGHRAAAVAAFAYAFSTFLAVWLYYPMGATAAWLPGVALGALAVGRGERRAVAGTVAVAVGMAVSGHPESLAHGALLAALLAGVSLLWPVPGGRRRAVGRFAATALLAFCLAAPVLLPFLDALPESQRTAVIDPMGGKGLAPPFEVRFLTTLVNPLVFGSPRDRGWQGPWNFNELCSGYGGLAALALAVAGALWLRGRVALVMAGGAAALLGAFGLQPVEGMLRLVPLFGYGAHGRLRLVWVLAVAVAAGLTVDRLFAERPPDGGWGEGWSRSGLRWAAAASLLVAALGLWLMPPPGAGWQRAWWLTVLAGLVLVAVVVVLSGGRLAGPAGRRRATGLVLLVVAADLFLLGVRYNPSLGPLWRLGAPLDPGEGGLTVPPPAALAALVRQVADEPQPTRVAAEGWDLLPNLPALWGLWDPRGNDPMRPAAAASYVRFRLTGLRRPESWALARPGHIDYRGGYDRLAVRHVLTPHRRNMPPPWRLVAGDVGGRVWENGSAVGMFHVPAEVWLADDAAAARRATEELTDPVTVAVVEGLEDRRWMRTDQRGEVTVERVEANGFRLRVRSPDGVVVASSVSHTRHWRVRLADGGEGGFEPRRLVPLRVHAAFLAFAVPSGEHLVEVVYAPPGWRRGLLLAAAALLLVALVAVGRMVRRRRSPRHRPAVPTGQVARRAG